jgi:hypothetical protein
LVADGIQLAILAGLDWSHHGGTIVQAERDAHQRRVR